VKTWLLDAGPIVVLLDRSSPAHEPVRVAMSQFRGHLITTSAVITEAFHLVRRYPRGPERVLEFLKASGTTVQECCQPDDLQRAVTLMTKYADTPMDFADATLVLLGEQLNQYHICTLDRRGFSTFRTATGKRFNLVIDGM
jgi:predicted nucleic acid-binding protein